MNGNTFNTVPTYAPNVKLIHEMEWRELGSDQDNTM